MNAVGHIFVSSVYESYNLKQLIECRCSGVNCRKRFSSWPLLFLFYFSSICASLGRGGGVWSDNASASTNVKWLRGPAKVHLELRVCLQQEAEVYLIWRTGRGICRIMCTFASLNFGPLQFDHELESGWNSGYAFAGLAMNGRSTFGRLSASIDIQSTVRGRPSADCRRQWTLSRQPADLRPTDLLKYSWSTYFKGIHLLPSPNSRPIKQALGSGFLASKHMKIYEIIYSEISNAANIWLAEERSKVNGFFFLPEKSRTCSFPANLAHISFIVFVRLFQKHELGGKNEQRAIHWPRIQ